MLPDPRWQPSLRVLEALYLFKMAWESLCWLLVQFAYSIASTQAPGGPLQYDLHRKTLCTALC